MALVADWGVDRASRKLREAVETPRSPEVLFWEAGRNRCLPTQFVLKAYPRGEANWSTTYSLLTARIQPIRGSEQRT